MNCIGFKFMESQEELRQWQLNNPKNKILQIQPHASKIPPEGFVSDGLAWGIFLTYSYKDTGPAMVVCLEEGMQYFTKGKEYWVKSASLELIDDKGWNRTISDSFFTKT